LRSHADEKELKVSGPGVKAGEKMDCAEKNGDIEYKKK